MTITNGYATLPEIRERLLNAGRYTASTISFVEGTKKIVDTAHGLKRFQTGDAILISGSVANNGYFTVATGNVAGEIVVTETVVTGAAGPAVTIQTVTDVGEDAILEAVVEATSRLIDGYCGRFFWLDSADATRYYTAGWPDLLITDDIVSITTLSTDSDGDGTYEDTWTTADWEFEPYNAALEGYPYTCLRTKPNGDYDFPSMRKGVKIEGKFGWPAVPKPVKEACLLQAERLAKRKDAPFGVVGSTDMGQMQVIPKLDPDVKLLLEPYRRLWVGAV